MQSNSSHQQIETGYGEANLTASLTQVDRPDVDPGSFNWSPSAAHQNDETLLVFDSPLLAAHFTAEINRLWKGAELGITERLARKQERQRNRCGRGVQRG